MRLGEDELVTSTTQRSGRHLVLVIGFFATFIVWFDIPLEDLKVLGVTIPPEAAGLMVFVILVYLLISLLMHWISDFISWRAWFGKIPPILTMDMSTAAEVDALKVFVGRIKATLPQLEKLSTILDTPTSVEDGKVHQHGNTDNIKAIKEIKDSINKARGEMSVLQNVCGSIKRDLKILRGWSAVALFVQYGALPLAVAILALWLLWPTVWPALAEPFQSTPTITNGVNQAPNDALADEASGRRR